MRMCTASVSGSEVDPREHSKEPSGTIKGGEFLDHRVDY